MVIVFNHVLVSSFLFYRNPHRFLVDAGCKTNGDAGSGKSKQSEKDGETKLWEKSDFRSLHEQVKEAINYIASKSVTSLVYLLDKDSGELYADKENTKKLPKNGICWEAWSMRKARACHNLDPGDPLVSELSAQQDNTGWKPKSVLCYPIDDSQSGRCIALIVVGSNFGEEIDAHSLMPLAEQIVACYRNMCKCDGSTGDQYRETSPPTSSTTTSDKEAIVKLCGELYDQNTADLQRKIVRYLEEHTNAEFGFMLLVVPETQELYCQVIGDKVLDQEIRFPGETSPFSAVLESKDPLRLENITEDKKKEMEVLLGRSLQSLMCVPVTSRNYDGLVAIACVANKFGTDSFTSEDLQTIQTCFKYTAAILTNTLAFQNERKLKKQTQAMLEVAKNLFTHLDDLTKLLREIMQEARNLTQAERCSVFLIDEETEELVAKVFDGITTNDKEVQSEIRMPIIQGIAGHVATTGKLLNIKDAYSHPMFYRGIDDSTGFRTRNILCFPIKNEAGNVLGVAQLCNKKTGPFFTVFDEDVASAFAVYCCISISHSLMYQRVIAAQIRNSLANELMMYHMKVAQEEVDTLAHMEINSPSFWHADFDKFSFPPRMIPEDDTEMACLTMFEDLGFITKFRIRRDTLARFVLMVRRGYRNPPYHNWMHAFAVTHFCYVCMKNLKLTQYLEDIEMFSLFTSCMCHDIDHRGTNNSYQSVSKSVLAALYSSEGSVLERHHFAQSMCIVNTDGCNLFENLSSKDYQQALDLMRDIILATDLAHHLRILKNIETMAKTGYDKENTKHHKLLLCLLMTASDLSDQTKPWDSTKHIAALIYKEFFSQGDMEKSMGREPIEMMDRERARIPDLQIGFLDHIALPVYKVLAELFPAANSVKVAVEDNRRHWDKICALIKIRRGGSCEQMSYDQILALEAEDHLPQTNQSNHIQ
ncbi:cGMP-dependent 3',5'-cyclic phosphodiesterase-like isoform X4 [Mizuhopecten yessoensis]|uniref:Phosphodiesterase n=1 Tax=Mizuhopecten yessoensis TaxID=6573 RepID=A0A210QC06_MIZYE|nr:cGMP-dependent 3',5'-cyclic phosphodiesterase-like isoform X4 [Mizuhopecten yessoensis]OWF46276.1 cGMP-dependent 3',5'-cyclic phosphodiesterase [Mizuhopecten yessoensis]